MRILLLAVAVMLLGGCVGSVAPAATKHIEISARLHGFVLDVEHRPLGGARVLAGDVAATSAADGAYALKELSAGRVLVKVVRPGFEPFSMDVLLAAGAEERRDFRLTPLARPATFNETFPFHGRFDCAHELMIIGGDCLVLYREATGQNDPVTDEKHAFRLPVKPGWSRITVNLSWQMAAENQFDGMRLYLEHGNGSAHAYATSVAQAEGKTSPLELVLERGVVHPSAERYEGTNTRAQLSFNGEELQIRVFTRGRMSDELGSVCHEGRCFLGVGVGLELDFDVAARVFYAP